MGGSAGTLGIEHVFVLMLENRSFDHMLGFSDIAGTDAVTGEGTAIDGLTGSESNLFQGTTYKVTRGAGERMPADPNHEFPDVLHQLCGPSALYERGGAYPPIDNTGYVASYVTGGGSDPREIMKCFAPEQLPVLNALAREFVVCDNWHASMPGPTWPNRMFVHAASSGGLDHSPSVAEIAEWEGFRGLPLANGTIFDRLKRAGTPRRLYGGDHFPMVAALKGIHPDDIRDYALFAPDVADANYPDRYIFIEPSYDVLNNYRDGTSQHPLADVTRGEALIKATYEAIRNSPIWKTSVLIVTWDEHRGFYDHAIPPPAKNPGDTGPSARFNHFGFTFEQYGSRVPAVVISPLIPRNLVDHRVYDHASIPATLEALFGLSPLTARDANANRLDALFRAGAQARNDAPETLPDPAPSSAAPMIDTAAAGTDSVNQGNLPAVVHAAMRQEMAVSPPETHGAIVARVANLKTRADAAQYMAEVQQKVRPPSAATSGTPAA